jgi:PAS domain S-box-containing protein
MFMLDLKEQRLWVSDQLRELFGFPQGEVKPEAFDERLHPEDRLRRAQAIARATETGLAYRTAYRISRPDGSQRWIASHGRAEFDAMGTGVRLHGVCIDLTEQHDAEVAARR